MIVVGIDPSLTYTALCVMTDKPSVHPQMFAIKTKPTDHKHRLERLTDMYNRLDNVLSHYHTDMVFVEGYSFGTKNHRAEAIAEWGGLIRHTLYTRNIPIVEVPPSVLKKFVTGKGNAEKSLMLREVFRKWQYDAKSDNEADAYGLAKMALAYQSQTTQPKTIVDMFDKLEVLQ